MTALVSFHIGHAEHRLPMRAVPRDGRALPAEASPCRSTVWDALAGTARAETASCP